MCQVYLANDPQLGRDVALKVLPMGGDNRVDFSRKFKMEARAVARLNHPNVLQVHDFGEDRGFAFLVTEHIPGGTFQDMLGAPMPIGKTVEVIRPLANALDYAHSQGIVHRDVKPSNVLMDPNRGPVLADFGLATLLEASNRLTAEGSLLGTPQYMAPEVVLGRPVDSRADIYALGVIVYQMLLGKTPFDADTPAGTALAHVHEPLKFPEEADAILPDNARLALTKALAKDPAGRHRTATELVDALRVRAGHRGQEEGAGAHNLPDTIEVEGSLFASLGKISVYLVEDHTLVLEALRMVLDDDDRITIVGVADSAERAIEDLQNVECDVVLMDVALPGIDGIEATGRLKQMKPELRVLILSGYGEQYLDDAIAAGADGYILKTADTGRVRRAIREVYSGETPLDSGLARSLFNRVARNGSQPTATPGG
jgi:CheY-like chemotaxis protein